MIMMMTAIISLKSPWLKIMIQARKTTIITINYNYLVFNNQVVVLPSKWDLHLAKIMALTSTMQEQMMVWASSTF